MTVSTLTDSMFGTSPDTLVSVARTHVGRVRIVNEDRVFDCPDRRMWAVADGMGGHAGGDLAAQAVVDRLRTLTASERTLHFTDMLVALGQANGDIRHRNDRLRTDAGSTVVAAMIHDRSLFVAWAGDSRAYLLRNGNLQLLTRDHSLVQDLVDAGLVPASRAENHPKAHVITRALGADDNPQLQTLTTELQDEDRVLLCSDGLSRSLQSGDVGEQSVDQLAEDLLSNALARDGSDNISLTLIEYRSV